MLTIKTGARASGLFFIACASLLATSAAHAAVANSTLNVDATVTANCTVSTSPLSFGDVNPLSGSNVDGTGGISVTCTNGTGWVATAGVGSGTGANYSSRRMMDGSNQLNYNLYTTSGYGTVWGDGGGGTGTFSNTGNGAAQNSIIYGRVGSGQNTVPPGSYDDTVSVTVTY